MVGLEDNSDLHCIGSESLNEMSYEATGWYRVGEEGVDRKEPYLDIAHLHNR